MLKLQHKNLDKKRWGAFPFTHQVLMIANEINRAKNVFNPDDQKEANLCLERALELVFLKIDNLKKSSYLKEFLRLKEFIAEQYINKKKKRKDLEQLFKATISLDGEAFKTEN